MHDEKVIVIIPTYNEALVIEQTIREIFASTQGNNAFSIHILIFDSASTDETVNIVRRLQTEFVSLHLQREKQKTGLGSAYLQAMQYALYELRADIVIEFDADLSHQPKYLLPMLEQLKKCDVVVGSRYVEGGSIPKEWGWHRKVLSVLGNYVARGMLSLRYKDFTSGYRATRRHALLKALPKKFLTNHYAYKIQLLWSLHKQGARIVEYPIQFIDREKGNSKLPANSIIDSLRVVALLRFFEMKRYVTMCAVGALGIAVQLFVYNALRMHLPVFRAAQLAVFAAIINNFLLNNSITFREHKFINKSMALKSLSLFVCYSFIMIYLQSYWLHLGVYYLGGGYIRENLIMISGIIAGSLLNYLTYSRVVWRERFSINR